MHANIPHKNNGISRNVFRYEDVYHFKSMLAFGETLVKCINDFNKVSFRRLSLYNYHQRLE